jgi:hypothetical protein
VGDFLTVATGIFAAMTVAVAAALVVLAWQEWRHRDSKGHTPCRR